MVATLSVKGQITMPKPIRDKCGLEVGDKLNFLLRDDGVLEVVPIKQPASKLKGMLPKPSKAVSIELMNKANTTVTFDKRASCNKLFTLLTSQNVSRL